MKAVVKKLWVSVFSFLIVATLILSCTKKPDTVGLDLVDDNTPFLGYDTTIEIRAYSMLEDSVVSDELSVNLLGSMATETFGITTANLYTQIRTSLANPDFGEGHVFDSAKLTMLYHSAYGNLSTQQHLKVFRLVKDTLFIDSTYYSNVEFDKGALYAEYSFTPDTALQMIIDTSGEENDTSYQTARTVIDLNEQFLNDINSDSIDWNTNDDFIETFKGLCILSEDVTVPGKGAIVYFDLLNDYSNITLYYHNNDDDSLTYDFPINYNCARVGNYEHDYFGSEVGNLIFDDTIQGDEYLYLQCLGGVKTELSFPGIQEWANDSSKLINEATLIFTLSDDIDKEMYPPPTRLVMLKNIDTDDEPDGIADGFGFLSDQLQGDDYFGGRYKESNNTYTFRVSLHLQDLLGGEVDLGVDLYPTAKSVTANGMKLYGVNPGSGKVKLQIIYTDLD